MAADKLVNCSQLAKIFGVPKSSFSLATSGLSGFPAHKCQSRHGKFYSLAAVKAWAKGKDVAGQVRAINAAKKRKKYDGKIVNVDSGQFNEWCLRFAAGEFMPAQQQQQIEFKRLVARTVQPKTQTQRLVFDWMLEDGPRANHRRTACNP